MTADCVRHDMLLLIVQCEIYFLFSFLAENGRSFSFSFIFWPKRGNLFLALFILRPKK